MYESDAYPFTIGYPDVLSLVPDEPSVTALFGGLDRKATLTIVERKIATLLGFDGVPLNEYAFYYISYAYAENEIYEPIALEETENANGHPFVYLEMDVNIPGTQPIKLVEFIYAHEQKIAFHAIYIIHADL